MISVAGGFTIGPPPPWSTESLATLKYLSHTRYATELDIANYAQRVKNL